MSVNDSKRYYWLKLKKDFFKQHEIKIVEGMENGKDYILFYLKLLVESVSYEGNLRFSETIPYSHSMLSSLTNTNIDTVRSAMKIFTELKMIEVLGDATIHMAEVQKLIGNETGIAKRVRDYRERRDTKRLQEGYNVTKRLEIRDKIKEEAASYTKNNIDIENSNLNISNQFDTVFKYYEQNISPLTPIVGEKLKALIDEVGEIKVRMAITEAATHDARSYAYIEAVAHKKGNRPTKVNEMPGAERCETQLDADTEKLYQKMLKGECNNEGGFE